MNLNAEALRPQRAAEPNAKPMDHSVDDRCFFVSAASSVEISAASAFLANVGLWRCGLLTCMQLAIHFDSRNVARFGIRAARNDVAIGHRLEQRRLKVGHPHRRQFRRKRMHAIGFTPEDAAIVGEIQADVHMSRHGELISREAGGAAM
jgi:hypothetical protein